MAPKDEVKYFNDNGKDWWVDDTRILRTINCLRIPFVANGLRKTNAKVSVNSETNASLDGVKILDVGCGGGIFSEGLAELGAKVTGIDPGNELIKAAKEHAALNKNIKENLTYICTTIEDHTIKYENHYDSVVCSEVVEHITNQDEFLKNNIKCLKPGGSFFLTTFHKSWWSWFIGIILYEFVFGVIPKGTHDYNLFISQNDCKQILEKHGCKIVEARDSFMNPFNRKWYFLNFKVHYFLHAVKK